MEVQNVVWWSLTQQKQTTYIFFLKKQETQDLSSDFGMFLFLNFRKQGRPPFSCTYIFKLIKEAKLQKIACFELWLYLIKNLHNK